MFDQYTTSHLNAHQQYALRWLLIYFGRIFERDAGKQPERTIQAKALLAVVAGWMSMSSGTGKIHIDVFGMGVIDLELDQSRVLLTVNPWLPLGIKSEPFTAFRVHPRFGAVFEANAMGFANRILERLSRRSGGIDDYAMFTATWQPTPQHLPGPHWALPRPLPPTG